MSEPQSASELFAQMRQTQQADRLDKAMAWGMRQDPQNYSQALMLSRRLGVQPTMLTDPSTRRRVAEDAQVHDFDAASLVQSNPALSQWLAAAPDNAAVAHDDLFSLKQLEDAASQVVQFIPQAAAKTLSALGGGMRLLGALTKTARPAGPASTRWAVPAAQGQANRAQVGQSLENAGQALQDFERPMFEGPAIGDAHDTLDWLTARPTTLAGKGTAFLGNVASTLGKAVLTGPAAPALFGLEAAGAKAGEALDTGATPGQAAVEAGGSGALNTLLGSLTLPGATAGKGLVATMAVRGVKGAALGAGTTLAENSLTRIHRPDQPLTEGMGENIASFLGMEGAGLALERMAEASRDSKLRQRAPETFREVAQAITDGSPVDNVQMPAQAWNTFWQSKGQDPAEMATRAGAQNYAEALAAGTDVVIPMADYLTTLAPEYHQELAPDLRLRPDLPTPREWEAYQKESAQVEQQVKAEGEQAVQESADPAFQAIKEDTRRQLVAAGDSEDVAETRATIHAAAMTNLARRAGMDPMTLQQAYGLRITRPLPGEAGDLTDRVVARLADEQDQDRTLYQSSPKIDEATGLPLNPDGTVTLYHHTSAAKAEAIRKSGVLKAEAEPDVYVTTRKETDTGYGDTAVPVKVRPERLILDDEFPDGRKDFRIHVGRPGGRARVLFQGAGAPFADGQVRGPGDIPDFMQKHVLGVPEGVAIPNPAFHLGRMTPEGAGILSKLIPGVRAEGPDLYINGRALKHANNDHGRHLMELIRELPDLLQQPARLFRNDNPKYPGSAILVWERPGDELNPFVIVEISKRSGGDLEVINLWKARNRTLNSLARKGAELPDGRRPIIPSGPEEPGTQSAKISAFQQLSESNVPPSEEGGKDATFFPFVRESPAAPLAAPEGGGAPTPETFGEELPQEDHRTEPGSGKPETLFQWGGGRYASAAEKRSAQMRRLALRSDKAFLAEMTRDHEAQQAQAQAEQAESQARQADFEAFLGENPPAPSEADRAAFEAWDADVRALVAGDVHESEHRAFIQFGNDNRVQIGFLEQADLSSFTHETGHLYVKILQDLAERPDAPQQVKDDLAALRRFVGADPKGAEPLTEAQQEKLARANEAYLAEGKAPSEGLRGVFQRVKFWMLTVYRNLLRLNVKLTDPVREVFDRIYASDEEIEAARREVDDRPLFATPEDMQATQAEFDGYVERAGKAIAEAKERLASRLVQEVRRERETWWKEESAKVRGEVAAEVDQDPVYRAFRTLADGHLEDGTPIKLNRQALQDRFGEATVKALPRAFHRLYARDGGMDADAAAELLGFSSGEDLVNGLQGMEPRREHIARLTEERMKERHGDLMAPEAIAAAAQEALHGDVQGQVKLEELRHLRRMERATRGERKAQAQATQAKAEAKAAQAEARAAEQGAQDQARAEAFWARGVVAEVPPLATFRKAAVELVESQPTKDLEPYRYLVTQRKESREAFEALAKKDYKAAGDAKQKELLNHFLYREAMKAQDEVEAAYRFARRFGKASLREKLAKAGGEQGQHVYLDQIDNILERFQFTRESNKAIDARQSLADFAIQNAKAGEMVELDPVLFADQPKNYRELTLPELRSVRDALANLEAVARRQIGFISEGKQVTFDQARDELVQASYRNTKAKPLPLDPSARSRMDQVVSKVKKLNAELLKMEEIVDRLDGGDINGPWRRYVFEPMCQAQYKEFELNQAITARLAEAMEAMPKEQRLSLGDRYEIEGLDGPVTRKWILSVALNMGNESNQAKMFKGMGWADPVHQAAVGRALDHLNRADWEFVQRTWDALETLWPEIEALDLRMKGFSPKRVPRRAFTVHLADGTTLDMQGGYYPVAWDPERSTAGARQNDLEIMNSEGGFSGPVTAQGHTRERVEQAAYPMLLDFEQVLSRHVARVIKDLSHREPALAVAKLIRDQQVRAAVQATLGPEFEAQLLPWLKGTVNDTAVMNPELGKFMLRLRSNMVVAGLAFRASSVIVQVTDLARVMVGEHAVKPTYVMSALAKLARDFAVGAVTMDGDKFDLIHQVRALSPEMAARAENLDRDYRARLRQLQGKDGTLAHAQKIGMAGLAIMDTISSHTAWWAAYQQALGEGRPQPDAVRMANRVVGLKIMGGAPKDLTALQRNPDVGMKMLSTYMGDAVAVYGMMSRAAHEIGQGRNVGRSLFAALMVGMVVPMLGDLLKNRGPQDDDDKLAWAANNMAWNLPSSLPFARDVASALSSGRDYQFTPLAAMINRTVVHPIERLSSDRPLEWEDWFLTGLDSVGSLGGLPGTSQLVTSGRYLRDVQTGKQRPDSDLEATLDAVFGPPLKKK